ncbi:MAG TPA: hypothetical protein VKG82_06920 [Solirubrobacteraceae bacterium]|nr:hypothetical protein [Solirubrobacteraceae bacterium]
MVRALALATALAALIVPAASAAPAGVYSGSACELRSLPSFVAQGDGEAAGSVADIVRVSCDPRLAGRGVVLDSSQLYERCARHLAWSLPYPLAAQTGPMFAASLDADGNLTVALWAGPGCAPGPNAISAQVEEEPEAPAPATFTVMAPRRTYPLLTAQPAAEIEDPVHGSVATVIEVAFPPAYAGQSVNLSSGQLLSRCLEAPVFTSPATQGPILDAVGDAVELTLDGDGGAFVVALAGGSCASGPSEIEATLLGPPYTRDVTRFTVQPPQPSVLAPHVYRNPLSVVAEAGTGTTFSAGASGRPTPTVQWQVSLDAGDSWEALAGATGRTLSIAAVTSDSGREYRAVFTNSVGQAFSDAATLTVTPPTQGGG